MSGPDEQPVTRLRGAGVDVDRHRLVRIATAVLLGGLAVSAVVLLAVGFHEAGQIEDLQNHGRTVEATVTGCLGLLGGSGSNAAGFSCKATYGVDGHRYVQTVPDSIFRRPGAHVTLVVAADDPMLVSTPGALGREPASWRVFSAPVVLLVLFLAGSALVLRSRHRAPRR